MRHDGRKPDQLRELDIEPDYLEQPHGSVLYAQGKTIVLCNATVEEGVPRWLYKSGRGWMTAEYAMLPASTGERTQRGVSRGRPDGRTVEIQRLIGRSLRGIVDFEALGERTVYIDCDVLQADGGTRCASITGGFVALELACRRLLGEGKSIAEAAKALEISEQTFHRWRNQYGGMKADDARRLKELERENALLKRIVADKELENVALKEIAKGNW